MVGLWLLKLFGLFIRCRRFFFRVIQELPELFEFSTSLLTDLLKGFIWKTMPTSIGVSPIAR
jgi:hypothetical protein